MDVEIGRLGCGFQKGLVFLLGDLIAITERGSAQVETQVKNPAKIIHELLTIINNYSTNHQRIQVVLRPPMRTRYRASARALSRAPENSTSSGSKRPGSLFPVRFQRFRQSSKPKPGDLRVSVSRPVRFAGLPGWPSWLVSVIRRDDYQNNWVSVSGLIPSS